MRKILASLSWLGPKGRAALVMSFLLVVAGGLGWFLFGDRIKKRVDYWRADRLLKEAQVSAKRANWKETFENAWESQELRRSYGATRLIFKSLREMRDSSLLEFGVSLFHHKSATAQDRLDVLEATIMVNDILTAGKLAEQLREEECRSPEMRRHLVRIAARSGRYQEALGLVEIGSGAESDPGLDLLLAREFARASDERLRAQTLARLQRVLAGTDDELALQAFRVLSDLPGHWIEVPLAQQAADRFAPSPNLEPADRLRLAVLQIGMQHGKKEDIVRAAVSAYRGTHLPLLSNWLLRLGEYEQILELTDPAEHPDGLPENLFFHRAQALEGLEHFDELAAELDDVNVPLPPPILWAMRASVAWKQGEGARAVSMWKQALERAEADDSRNYYYQMADLAEEAEEEHLRLEALAMAVEHRLGLPPPARKLQAVFSWLYAQGNTERLLRLTYRLLRREPSNPMLINNYHYLRALHEEPAPEAEKQLEELLEGDPDRFAYRDSLALVQLREGNPGAALSTLEAGGKKAEELENIAMAIYAAALDASGRTEEAMALAKQVDWTQLAAREVAVLQPGKETRESDLPKVWDRVRDPAQGNKGAELPNIKEKIQPPKQDEDE